MAEQGQSAPGGAGIPVMGVVTTAAPTYVTATYGFLSLDTNGALRISGTISATEASVGATGAAVPASANYIGINIGGNLTGALGGHGTAAGALRVELPTDGTGVVGLNAGSAVIGKVGIDQTTPGTTNAVVVTAVAAGGASFLNIAAGQATTTVKSGAGTLYAIVLNSAATATNTTTIYDNTAASGTVIGRPAVTTATVPTTLTFGPSGLAFTTGLTIITANANGGDMTVVYK